MSQAFRMLATSSLVNGAVGGSVILGAFRWLAGFVGIQPLSCTNRKKARNASSFLRAEIFLFFQEARNRRTQSMSKSVMHGSPCTAAKSCNCRKSKRYL